LRTITTVAARSPGYSDVKYIEALIAPDTVNTAPLETINAYRDHGEPQVRLEQNVGEAAHLLNRLPLLGIDLDQMTQQLKDEGVAKSNKPFDTLMDTLTWKVS
jgi:transaldolase